MTTNDTDGSVANIQAGDGVPASYEDELILRIRKAEAKYKQAHAELRDLRAAQKVLLTLGHEQPLPRARINLPAETTHGGRILRILSENGPKTPAQLAQLLAADGHAAMSQGSIGGGLATLKKKGLVRNGANRKWRLA